MNVTIHDANRYQHVCVHWRRTCIPKMGREACEGYDDCASIAEAIVIAEARLMGAGLPAMAEIYLRDDDNTVIRSYSRGSESGRVNTWTAEAFRVAA